MSLFEQNAIRKEWMNKKISDLDFDNGDSKKYKVEAIQDNTIYVN